MRPKKEPTFDIKLATMVEVVQRSFDMKKVGYPLEYIPILKEEVQPKLLRLIAQELTSCSFRELIAHIIVAGSENSSHPYPEILTDLVESILAALQKETNNPVMGKEIADSIPLVIALDAKKVWDSNNVVVGQFNLNVASDERFRELFVSMWQQGLTTTSHSLLSS